MNILNRHIDLGTNELIRIQSRIATANPFLPSNLASNIIKFQFAVDVFELDHVFKADRREVIIENVFIATSCLLMSSTVHQPCSIGMV